MENLITFLSEYLGQELEYGANDCNLLFLEYFEPDKHKQMLGKYSTQKGGFKYALNTFGYRNINEYLKANDEWIEVPLAYASDGDVLINKQHVSFCLGNKTFLYSVEFKQYITLQTSLMEGTVYRRLINE